ncbi:hypothetical protein AB4090_04920 [Acidithiobacillus sp. IBUN Pt1247-S3]|uniref:hypothetical protein n=1 Tax=Acidithiobacillus sp. IBUN Pt1247-S3 TaxID=3166642 RepID=UPI0034E4905F
MHWMWLGIGIAVLFWTSAVLSWRPGVNFLRRFQAVFFPKPITIPADMPKDLLRMQRMGRRYYLETYGVHLMPFVWRLLANIMSGWAILFFVAMSFLFLMTALGRLNVAAIFGFMIGLGSVTWLSMIVFLHLFNNAHRACVARRYSLDRAFPIRRMRRAVLEIMTRDDGPWAFLQAARRCGDGVYDAWGWFRVGSLFNILGLIPIPALLLSVWHYLSLAGREPVDSHYLLWVMTALCASSAALIAMTYRFQFSKWHLECFSPCAFYPLRKMCMDIAEMYDMD